MFVTWLGIRGYVCSSCAMNGEMPIGARGLLPLGSGAGQLSGGDVHMAVLFREYVGDAA